MAQEVGFPSPTPSSTPLSWSEVWVKAITRPSVSTFEELVRDSNASTRRALSWMFISGLIGYLIFVLAYSMQVGISSRIGISIVEISIFIFGALVTALISVLAIMISAGITQLIAGALGGTGTYSELVYTFAAFLAPLTLIVSVIGSFPFGTCLAFPLEIYGMVLSAIAVKTVHQFGWGRAIGSSFLIIAGILAPVVIVVLIVVLALAGILVE